MKTTLHRIGNSQGVIIPKPFLVQVGLTREVEIEIERDTIVIRKPRVMARAGWAEESKTLATSDADRLAWPEFSNEGDANLEW